MNEEEDGRITDEKEMMLGGGGIQRNDMDGGMAEGGRW